MIKKLNDAGLSNPRGLDVDAAGNMYVGDRGNHRVVVLSPDGKVMVSESTTSVTVRDRPGNVQLVEQFIANINKNLSKQVLVKVQVLEVNLENSFEFV